jgi:hypothetical protein
MASTKNTTKRSQQISEDLLNIKSSLELLRQEFIKLSGEAGVGPVEAVKKLSGAFSELEKSQDEAREAAIQYQKKNTKSKESNDLVAGSLKAMTSQSKLLSGEIKERLNPALEANKLRTNQLASAEKEASLSAKDVVTAFGQEIKSVDALTRAEVKLGDTKERVQRLQRSSLRSNDNLELRTEVDLLNQSAAASNGFFKEIQLQVKAQNKAEEATNRLNTANEKALKSQRTFGQAFRQAFSPKAIGAAVASIIKFIGVYEILGRAIETVKYLTVGSVEAFVEYEDKIGRLGSVLLASESQMKEVSGAIRGTAVETRFTANEVAELAVSLAKLGATSSEIPSLISPIASAAQAIGEDLSSVGETILKVNNQFGISSAESAITASTLTSAINDSALSLESFNRAIQYIGPVASQVGFTFGETSEYLKALADSGFSASRIGTGLRTIFTKLKRPGEELSETLDNLAKKNITVAEATQLVGRTASAQLLTVVKTKEAFDEQRAAAESLGLSLAASASQMSTFSGQVDILKSAFDEFRLRIGESIVNTELFLELIGLFSSDSEALARGYELINQVVQKNTNVLSDNIGTVYEGASAYGTIIRTLEDTEIYVTKLEQTFGQLNSNLKNSGSKLTLDEAFEAFVYKVSKGSDAVNEYLDSIGKNTGKNAKLITEIGESVFPGDLEDQALAVFGYFRRVQDGVKSLRDAARAEQYRTDIQRQYKDELEAVEELGTSNVNAQERALVLEVKIGDKRKELIDLQKQEQSKGSGASSARLLQYQAEISGLDEYRQRLSEFNADLVDLDKVKNESLLKEFNRRKKALDNEREVIENDSSQEQKRHNERVKQIEERTKKEVDSRVTLEEKQEAERKGLKEINDERQRYQETLDSLAERTTNLTDKSTKLFAEYGKIFKINDSNFIAVTNAQEQFGLSITKLTQDLISQRTELAVTPDELGLELYDRGNQLITEFAKGLKILEGQFDDTAFGQYQLGEAQRDYVSQAKQLLGDLQSEYEAYFLALSFVYGEEQAKEMLAPLKSALAILSSSINETIVSGTLSDKELTELRKKFIKLSETLAIPVEIIADATRDAISEALDAISRFNDVALENTKNRLDREKSLIQERYEVEDDILKAKLESQLITEAEYRAQIEKNRKKEAQAQNKIEKQIFEAQQKRDRQQALADYLTSLGSIIPNLVKEGNGEPATLSLKGAISAALVTVGYGLELRAINQRKFYPTKFAEGGVVSGPSHSEGGVPFTVRGQGGYEMEGGEYIVNKKSTQKYKSLLDQINGYGKSNYKFAAGGVVKDPTEVANRQIELLEAIASSNISMVGKLDKPVRAFVASNDLRSDENARRIQERNSQL